ncbi:XRN-Two binding domain, XTBD domain-containing protein [Ditylenchus destructor]|nr:XRN-Two binding domain, XTBD domain-containing protein [Ditylenchus destructor]
MSWIEEERGNNESGTQWKLRRAFLMRYENDYPKGRLKSLSMMFSNVIFLSCKYTGSIMKQIDQFAKDLEAEVQEAKQTKILREAFSLPTLDSDEEEDDEGQVDDYIKLSREMSRMKIPEPETIPSPLPRPGFTPTKRDFASPPTKRDIAPAPGLIPMSLIKMQDHKPTAVVRADMSRRQTQKKKPDNIDEGGEKQFVRKVTIVTASKSKNGKGDRKTPDNEKSDEKPANEECQDEELVGAVIAAEDLNETVPDKTACSSEEKQGENCQKIDDNPEETTGKMTRDVAEKESENCEKNDNVKDETPKDSAVKSVEKENESKEKSAEKKEETLEEIASESAEKQGENCEKTDNVKEETPKESVEKESDGNEKSVEKKEENIEKSPCESEEKHSENCLKEEPDEATTTIVKETDEEN